MDKQDEVIKILRAYMGFSCACDVAEEIDKLYKEATEYDYEEGEKGDFYANTINIKFKDDTIQG